jgi:hypothetical protein
VSDGCLSSFARSPFASANWSWLACSATLGCASSYSKTLRGLCCGRCRWFGLLIAAGRDRGPSLFLPAFRLVQLQMGGCEFDGLASAAACALPEYRG